MMMVTKSVQLVVLLVCCLTIITIQCANATQNPNLFNVEPTIVHSAASKGAVCLDGSPPAYYFEPGFGDGAENWIFHLSGGAWCINVTDCQKRAEGSNGSSKRMGPLQFQGIHSKNNTQNPDFYNWNKVVVAYCDGGSFIGDSEYIDPSNNRTKDLQFRGQKIFYTVLEEVLEKGLKNAKNAILAGSSAGGYPAILYCDYFRDSLPINSRVKCLVDSGYFVHFKNPVLERFWTWRFSGVAALQGAAKTLPKSCTSKMKAELCLYSENIQQYTKTPFFLHMSAFDNIETQYTLGDEKYKAVDEGLGPESMNASLREIRSVFLNAIPKRDNPKHRGAFIDAMHHHTSLFRRWSLEVALEIDNVLAPIAFADWYFDRKYYYLVDEKHTMPIKNTIKNTTYYYHE
uniref:Pectin acetylesterase n=1 Tax=Solanum lycopersicum TaxID=4081 RepID=A0A3Q7JR06_SOLLC|nr:pectin acetylesterase 7-like [Solanum lycopersicum]